MSRYLEYFSLLLASFPLNSYGIGLTLLQSRDSGELSTIWESLASLSTSCPTQKPLAEIACDHTAGMTHGLFLRRLDVLSGAKMDDEHRGLWNFLSLLILSCQNLAHLRNVARSFALPLM